MFNAMLYGLFCMIVGASLGFGVASFVYVKMTVDMNNRVLDLLEAMSND